ncbi:PEP-CTERM sorting domain-containing protein [Tundrisphaera lichenicola]|uniref:PEP-CTERM sorting domain-containing protein n=1 Tax=Tundrisphaera lichenicola TaxID=2029860 RepID=UPI003EBC2F7A
MMNRLSTRIALTAMMLFLGLAAGESRAAIIFSDDFDQESTGLNYNSFANWSISAGTVDTVGNGFFDFLPGNGVYVDLDGSTFNAGVMSSNGQSLAAGSYTLSFDLAGSQRGDTNVVTVSLGTSNNASLFGSTILTRDSADPFTTETINFVIGSPTSDFHISFSNAGGDNIGALLDRVVLQSNAVPEPASIVMMGLGSLGMIGYGWRRRKLAR